MSAEDAFLFPLSLAQEGLWLALQTSTDHAVYNIPYDLSLKGPLNRQALAHALQTIVDRHEALRTTFPLRDGEPCQMVHEHLPVTWQEYDLSARANPEAAAQRLMQDAARHSFDLAAGPLLKVQLLRLSDEHHHLVLVIHHLICDGWSLSILLRELAEAYTAFCAGQAVSFPPLPIQYADFAHWQRQWLQGSVLEEQAAYWRQRLASSSMLLNLPTDRSRPPQQMTQGAQYRRVFPRSTGERLTQLGRQEDCTLFMVLFAVFQTLLHRYTGQTDLLVGTPMANRARPEIQEVAGLFTNMIVLRNDLSGNPPFRELLRQVRTVTLDALVHQDLPFEKVVQILQPVRYANTTPLFQVTLSLQQEAKLPLTGLDVSITELFHGTAKFELTLNMALTPQGLEGNFVYQSALFDEMTMRRLADHFSTLLESILVDPDQPIALLPMLTPAEKHLLLFQRHTTSLAWPQDRCLQHQFETQAEHTPYAEAVCTEQMSLSYQQLNRRANQLAHYLRTRGIGPESRVAIYMERSCDLIVSVLGILKAGGAYVPLDSRYPMARLGAMLNDSAATLVLTRTQHQAELPPGPFSVLCLDRDWKQIEQQPDDNPRTAMSVTNLAYLIYTSGTTGSPKGVMITHQNALSFLTWVKHTFAQKHLKGVLASTSLCFDLSVFEIFAPLCSGGKMIIAEDMLHLPTSPLAEEITLINTVPSVMTEFLKFNKLPGAASLINLAGEPLMQPIVQQLYRFPAVQHILNLYGPTEYTTYTTAAWLNREDQQQPSIGYPIANAQVYVLDTHLEPLPIGVIGELYIGGPGLARGYLNQPDLTAERFIPHPFSAEPGARLYRTGDLARYRQDGQIEFAGRYDQQVKIRGFRIECSEIEATLARHPGVMAVAVLAREKEQEKQLVAYVVLRADQSPGENELRQFLREQLPLHMVPTGIIFVKELPLTPNGKLDRSALPVHALQPDSVQAPVVTPESSIEQTIATIWSQVLEINEIGIDDNFFDLGGYSLLMIRVQRQLEEQFHIAIPLIDMFRHPTVRAQAAYLLQTQDTTPALEQHQERGRTREASLAQQRNLRHARKNQHHQPRSSL